MAVLERIVPVGVEEAIALARAAAALTAQALHEAFQPQPAPVEMIGAPPLPRQVTPEEQCLATKIADHLHQDSDDVGALQDFADPTLEPGTVSTEEKVLVDNEALYRSITTQVSAVQAATIAAPGVHAIQCSSTYFRYSNWSKQPSPSRDENLVNAERLLASLATVSGTV